MRRFALFLIVSAAICAALIVPAGASAALFPQCPEVDKDTGCGFLIKVTNSGVTIAQDASQGPYDGEDDTLVGIVNESSKPVSEIALSSSGDIFGVDGDGMCDSPAPPRAPGCVVLAENASKEVPTVKPGTECKTKPEDEITENDGEEPCGHEPPPGEPVSFNPFTEDALIVGYASNGDAVSGYEGPRTWYSNIGLGATTGQVNFGPALAPGESTYFSLEEALTESSLVFGNADTLSSTLSGGGVSGASISVVQGTAVTDTATLGGSGASLASGTATYTVYSDPACTTAVAQAGTGAFSGATAAASSAVNLGPGKYYWRVSFGGDVNNQKAETACGSEILTVLAPTKTSTTQTAGPATGASLTVAAGTAVTDKAAISGALAASSTGSVTYTLYKNSTCTIPAAPSSIGGVTAGVAAASVAVKPAVGTYYWVASYTGDAANAGSASTCGSEILKVAKKASLGLPSSNICLSKRKFIVHPRAPKGVKLVHVEVFIDGKLKSQGSLSKGHTTVSLIGLPKGTYQVELVVTSSKGQLFEDVRTFHTCVPKKHHHHG
jgi:hypothetical protein